LTDSLDPVPPGLPDHLPAAPSGTIPEVLSGSDWVPVWAPPVRKKFQHRYTRHIILFVLTLATTTLVGATRTVWDGFWYSLPLLTILGAHEFGHYWMCRVHDVDATLPYFLPLPLPPTGTLGAVIRIRESFPSKQALFDIGVAGPIAGFVTLLPFLWIGLRMSSVLPTQTSGVEMHLGDPLLVQAMVKLHFGTLRNGYDVFLHPMGFAAWWGLLATALNLMPFGQLDGGHIVYSILGRRSQWVSIATLAAACLLVFWSYSWISMSIMLLVMAFFLGVRHPRIVDEDTPLDPRRRFVAFCALVIFILSFTPVPIDTFIK
jgi:membrane-associated protease RseP (regulator of RpoE activity)